MPRYSGRVKPYPNNIKDVIKMQGYRIKDVAQELDIPRTTLTDYIVGNRPAPRECLAKLAQYIGCSIDDFRYVRPEITIANIDASQSTAVIPIAAPVLSVVDTIQTSSAIPLPAMLCDVVPIDCATWFSEKLSEIIALVTQWQRSVFVPQFQKMLDRELRVFDEIKQMFDADEYFLSRRSALLVIATLPKGLVSLVQHQKAAFIEEDFIPACAASITACWYLLNGREFASVERTLSRYLSFLMVWSTQSSTYQQTAAYLAAQGCMLLSLVASHQMQFQQRIVYCRKAVEYAKMAGDIVLLVKALTMVGNAQYDSICYHKMLQAYQEAHAIVAGHQQEIPFVLQSKVLMGLAHAYAQYGQAAETLNAISEARGIFPEGMQDIPIYLSSDDGLFSLILFEGWVRLDLGNHHPVNGYYEQAAQSLSQIENIVGTMPVPERIRVEILNRRAQTAIALGDLEVFRSYTLAGIESLRTVKSEKRRQEIVANYRAARKQWPNQSQVLELAEVLL